MIRVEEVHKAYGKHVALSGVNLEVRPGEVVGLLGANGSGKTTLARCIATLIQPDQGTIQVGGIECQSNPDAVRSQLGYLAEYPVVYSALSAREFLHFIGGLRGLSRREAAERAQRWLELFELGDAADKPLGGYSQGMGRKAALAAALIAEPQCVLLDEPTNGLDPPSVFLFRKVIEGLRAEGRTVLLSSHVLPFVERSCDRIAILVDGQIAACGDLDELRAQGGRPEADLEELFLHFSGLDITMLQRLADAGVKTAAK